jgi:hypothetical protein
MSEQWTSPRPSCAGPAAEASPRRLGSAHDARGHRALATRGGAAGSGLSVAPVGWGWRLKHLEKEAHPLDMVWRAATNRGNSTTVGVTKIGSAMAFCDWGGAPAARVVATCVGQMGTRSALERLGSRGERSDRSWARLRCRVWRITEVTRVQCWPKMEEGGGGFYRRRGGRARGGGPSPGTSSALWRSRGQQLVVDAMRWHARQRQRGLIGVPRRRGCEADEWAQRRTLPLLFIQMNFKTIWIWIGHRWTSVAQKFSNKIWTCR